MTFGTWKLFRETGGSIQMVLSSQTETIIYLPLQQPPPVLQMRQLHGDNWMVIVHGNGPQWSSGVPVNEPWTPSRRKLIVLSMALPPSPPHRCHLQHAEIAQAHSTSANNVRRWYFVNESPWAVIYNCLDCFYGSPIAERRWVRWDTETSEFSGRPLHTAITFLSL